MISTLFRGLLLPALALVLAGVVRSDPPRLIIRVDDMGYSHAGNEAILKTCLEGVATSVEVIVPSPWFPEAVKMLAAHTNVDVGIHLALTSEWDNLKWRPVAASASLRDPDGYFFPMVFPNQNYPGRALSENPWTIQDVEQEFRAQIELGRRKLPRVTHVSYHMGCAMLNAEVRALAKRLAAEYQVGVDPGELGVKSVSYVGASKTSDEKREGFLRMLDGLEEGKTYLFVDHPGFDTPELRAIHHIGYEQVAADRQGVTETLVDPRVRERLRVRGIRLLSYRDLAAGR